jgi:hypothetical protein
MGTAATLHRIAISEAAIRRLTGMARILRVTPTGVIPRRTDTVATPVMDTPAAIPVMGTEATAVIRAMVMAATAEVTQASTLGLVYQALEYKLAQTG